jgi:DNA-binding response OmpR family regulator
MHCVSVEAMNKPCILLVGEESDHTRTLVADLTDAGYDTVTAAHGAEAMSALAARAGGFEAVLLDQTSSGSRGLQILRQMKARPESALLPVILQTERATAENMREGLQAGAYYHLLRPLDRKTMLAIVRSAVADYQRYQGLRAAAASPDSTLDSTLHLMTGGRFAIRTPEEARALAATLGNAVADGQRLAAGLMELIVNAIEHGNLGISYRDKSALLESGDWDAEVARRLALPANAAKRVGVSFLREPGKITFVVRDQGRGFDWAPYLEFSPARAAHLHGRGIAVANRHTFARIAYKGTGNEVEATYLTADAVEGECAPRASGAAA